jgi:hypothetical protein
MESGVVSEVLGIFTRLQGFKYQKSVVIFTVMAAEICDMDVSLDNVRNRSQVRGKLGTLLGAKY